MSTKHAFSKTLKELRLFGCPTGTGSAAFRYVGARAAAALTRRRSFVQRAYPSLKRHNPQTPIMVREATGAPAQVFARYGECVLRADDADARRTRRREERLAAGPERGRD
jgi:hypothetical protein